MILPGVTHSSCHDFAADPSSVLFSQKRSRSRLPLSMESYSYPGKQVQSYGYIVYRTQVDKGGALFLPGSVHDRTKVRHHWAVKTLVSMCFIHGLSPMCQFCMAPLPYQYAVRCFSVNLLVGRWMPVGIWWHVSDVWIAQEGVHHMKIMGAFLDVAEMFF